MSGNVATLDASARAALDAKKPLVYVCPPAAWAAAPILAALSEGDADRPRFVILAPETGDVFDLARTLRPLPGFEPIHPVTGIARAGRLLAAGAGRTLILTPRDAIRLVEASRLKLATVGAVALLWPEFPLAAGDGPLIDTLLAEASSAQRLIVTSDPASAKDLVERHAHRAPTAVGSQPPEHASVGARYVVADGERRLSAVRSILDTLNPGTTILWEPAPDRYERWIEFAEDPSVTVTDAPAADRKMDTAIAVELPSAEVLARLSTAASDVIVLIRASQLPYLQRIARTLKNLRIEGAADHARERAHKIRQAVRERIASEDVSSDLLALGPLFDEFDPALVAAALARGAGAPAPAESTVPAWVRLQLSVGKRDRVRPSDIVGALLNGVGLPKDHVGKVDIREGFSIVEVRAEDAARALRELAGLTVRGRALGARIAS